jgi:hypothetical protein
MRSVMRWRRRTCLLVVMLPAATDANVFLWEGELGQAGGPHRRGPDGDSRRDEPSQGVCAPVDVGARQPVPRRDSGAPGRVERHLYVVVPPP